MAIYHFSVQRISRGQGKSSVGASAYRAGEKLYNERDGLTHDYSQKSGIAHTEIIAPDYAPQWAQDRQQLWNQVERSEKRKDANTAREINAALPKELNTEQQKKIIREFVRDNFTSKGIVADIAMHDKGDGNPHVHIMLTTRAITPEGFESKKIMELDKKEKTVELWRESWANHTNRELERAGIQERIDHRSFIDQGIEKLPTRHEGYIVRAMEKRGIETEIGTHNRQAQEENKKLELIDRQIKAYEKQHERGIEHERTRSNGTQSGDIGTQGGIGRNQESGAARPITTDDIILRRTSRSVEINSERTGGFDKPGQRPNEKGRDIDNHIGRPTEEITRGAKDLDRESQQGIPGIPPGNERPEGKQQPEARSYAQEPVSRNTEQREQEQGNHETAHGIGVPSKEHSEPIMEGKSEAIRNTTIDNSRLAHSIGGSLPVNNAFSEILKTLGNSIQRAEQEAKQDRLDEKKSKTKSKDREPYTREQKNREMDRGMGR